MSKWMKVNVLFEEDWLPTKVGETIEGSYLGSRYLDRLDEEVDIIVSGNTKYVVCGIREYVKAWGFRKDHSIRVRFDGSNETGRRYSVFYDSEDSQKVGDDENDDWRHTY